MVDDVAADRLCTSKLSSFKHDDAFQNTNIMIAADHFIVLRHWKQGGSASCL